MSKNSRHYNDTNSLSTLHIFEIAKEFLPPPSRITKTKWHEILEQESVSHITGSIREEIIQSAADIICENYLQRAVYGFVTNCAHEAWTRAFQWVHLKYDNEGISATMSGTWTPDKASSPASTDSESSQKVPTVYGRFEKLIAANESSSHCEATCARNTLRDKHKRLNRKLWKKKRTYDPSNCVISLGNVQL